MLLPRVLTAIVLLALVMGALFYVDGRNFAFLALFLPVLGAWEWGGFFQFNLQQRWIYCIASLFAGIAMILLPNVTALWNVIFVLAVAFWLLLVPVWLKFRWKITSKPLAALTGWLLLFSAWQGVVIWHNIVGPKPLLALMLVVWIADTAAYFTGRAIGKHKLAPSVSPGKTWEGAAGAVIAVCVYALIIQQKEWLALPVATYGLLALAVLFTTVSIVGDLMESLFKRQAGLKDSGHILPGHGGILDRVDSLLAVLAVAGAAHWFLAKY
jgi:phosphatidate cytidylyltransferase